MVDAFEARQVGSTLHIMTKTHYSPWHPSLVPVIEGLAEAMAGTFNTQGMANTLWSYATMGQSPGAGVMLVLEGLPEAMAGTFNTQGVAKTLWAYVTMERRPVSGLMRELEGSDESVEDKFT